LVGWLVSEEKAVLCMLRIGNKKNVFLGNIR